MHCCCIHSPKCHHMLEQQQGGEKVIKIKLGFCSLSSGRHRSHTTPSQETEQLITQLSEASQCQQYNWLSHTASAFLSFHFPSSSWSGFLDVTSLFLSHSNAASVLTLDSKEQELIFTGTDASEESPESILLRHKKAVWAIRWQFEPSEKGPGGCSEPLWPRNACWLCHISQRFDWKVRKHSLKEFTLFQAICLGWPILSLGHLRSLSHFRLYVRGSPFLVWDPKPFRRLHFSL